MIKPEIIKALYKKSPLPTNGLNLELIKNNSLKHHSFQITDTELIINTLDKSSPFHSIPLRNIRATDEIENYFIIILRNSILFFNKENDDIHVHIHVEKPTFWQRLKYSLSKK